MIRNNGIARRWRPAFLAILAALVGSAALLPAPAKAWWVRGGWRPGIVVVRPPVVVGPPPVVVAPPVVYPPPVYAPRPLVWIPGHYDWRGWWIPGHWG